VRNDLFTEDVINCLDDDDVLLRSKDDVISLHSLLKKTNIGLGLLPKVISKNFKGYVRIHNLFNRRYQEVYGYGSEPRSFYIGIKGTF